MYSKVNFVVFRINIASCFEASWRNHWAFLDGFGKKVQPGEDDLPQVCFTFLYSLLRLYLYLTVFSSSKGNYWYQMIIFSFPFNNWLPLIITGFICCKKLIGHHLCSVCLNYMFYFEFDEIYWIIICICKCRECILEP